MSPQEKNMLFKIWNQLGPSVEKLKYLGIDSQSINYKVLLAEFLGLKGTTNHEKLISLEQHIKSVSNEFLSQPEASPCGGTIRMIGNGILESDSVYDRSGHNPFMPFKGIFAFGIPEDFVCEDLEVYSDIDKEYQVGECFTDDCLRSTINMLKEYLNKNFGLLLNHIEVISEDDVIGDIPIKKYS